MPIFTYEARDKTGQRVSGTREASDQRAALEALRESGFYVTQLAPEVRSASVAHAVAALTSAAVPANGGAGTAVAEPPPAASSSNANESWAEQQLSAADAARAAAKAGTQQPAAADGRPGAADQRPRPTGRAVPLPPAQVGLWKRANAKEMALFFRQMYAMINAGTSVSRALGTLGQHAANKGLREASLDMSRRTAAGMAWSETMRLYPGLFSELMIGMSAAGERGGFLDRMCLRLAEYSERDYEIEQTIKRETWYPKMLVFCAILIPSVVPLVLASVSGGNPFAAWLRSVWQPLLLLASAWAAWKAIHFMSPITARAGSPRHIIDFIKLCIPVGGKAVRGLAAAKFCRALGALQASGTGLSSTMSLAAAASGNAVIAESVLRVIPNVERGAGLTDSLAKTGNFPGIALQMLRTGEEAGAIEEQLDKVADFMEQDAETTIKQAVKALGVLVFLLIAVMIGIKVIEFYTGYFNAIFTEAGG